MCNKEMHKNYIKYSIDISKVAIDLFILVLIENLKSTITNHQST